GTVTEQRLRAYVAKAPEMMEFLENRSRWLEFVWKPGYADYYPELPGGSPQGSTINVPPIDLRELGEDEATLRPPAGAGAQGDLARPEGRAAVLPGQTELARQGGPAEADLADGARPPVRRPHRHHRPIPGRPPAPGAARARHPAVVERPDHRPAHRRRPGHRRHRRTRRAAGDGPRPPR